MIFTHHRPKPGLHLSAPPSMSSRSYGPLCFLFRSVSPNVPYCSVSGLLAFLLSWFQQYKGVKNPVDGLLHPDPFSASTPSLFLPRLFCFPLRNCLKTPVVALLHTYLLIALPTTPFLATFAIESLPYPGSALMLDVRLAISGILGTNVWLIARHLRTTST